MLPPTFQEKCTFIVLTICCDSAARSSCDAPGRREDVSRTPGRVVPAQVRVALRVLIRHAHPELCALVHLDLPVILSSDAQNRHTTHWRLLGRINFSMNQDLIKELGPVLRTSLTQLDLIVDYGAR